MWGIKVSFIDAYSAITGYNPITGDELTTNERALAVLGVVTGGVGSKLGKAYKAISNATEYVVKNKKYIKASKKTLLGAFDKVSDAYELVKKPAREIEEVFSKMTDVERVGKVRAIAQIKAEKYKWIKNDRLKKMNQGRDFYVDKKGTPWGVDTLHGRFEKFNKKTGWHEGEYNLDQEFVKNSINKSRRIRL